MVYFTIRGDPVPGKEDELDRFLSNDKKSFWMGQPGVKSYHVYRDKLLGWPERTITVEVNDLSSLQHAVDTDEHRRLRKQFFSLVGRAESQIEDMVI